MAEAAVLPMPMLSDVMFRHPDSDVAGVHTAASFTPSAATYMPFAHSESTARLEVMIEE